MDQQEIIQHIEYLLKMDKLRQGDELLNKKTELNNQQARRLDDKAKDLTDKLIRNYGELQQHQSGILTRHESEIKKIAIELARIDSILKTITKE